jgi:hypothetical protein
LFFGALKVGGLPFTGTMDDIDTIRIPDKFPIVANLIESNFPSIGIDVFNDDLRVNIILAVAILLLVI